MNSSRELRLAQSIFAILSANVVVVSEGTDVFEFAAELARETIQKTRDGRLDVLPEAVGVFVASRCNRLLSKEARAKVINEACSVDFGQRAELEFAKLLQSLGLDDTVEARLVESPMPSDAKRKATPRKPKQNKAATNPTA